MSLFLRAIKMNLGIAWILHTADMCSYKTNTIKHVLNDFYDTAKLTPNLQIFHKASALLKKAPDKGIRVL